MPLKNKLGLTLPEPVPENAPNGDAGDIDPSSTNSPFNIEQQLRDLQLSDSQRRRMEEWFVQKEKMGELNGEELEKICDIGAGNGGVVMKVRHKPSNIIMARKLIHLEIKPKIRMQIINELKVLHHCNSPYIVGFYGAFYQEGEISICMEYMDGLSLDISLKKSGPLPEPLLAKVSHSVLNGLCYLKEKHNLVHRDIKPSNILVNSQGEIKLCDFGVSGQLIDSMAVTFVGTRSYMSPERLQGSQYNVMSDVWSFGLTITELALGRYPIPYPKPEDLAAVFNCTPESLQIPAELQNIQRKPRPGMSPSAIQNNPAMAHTDSSGGGHSPMAIFELLDWIVNEPPPVVPPGIFSKDLVDLVERCLKKNPRERPNLRTLLEHPFVERAKDESTDFALWVRNTIQQRSGDS